jgi:four helix bundle protein
MREYGESKRILSLDKLKVYQLARDLSRISWEIYESLDWQDKKIMGNQFIESTDSVSANIAEGYGRFHYLDKVKFYFNGRGSLLESRNWIELLEERKKVKLELYKKYTDCYQNLKRGLSGLISSTMKEKKK